MTAGVVSDPCPRCGGAYNRRAELCSSCSFRPPQRYTRRRKKRASRCQHRRMFVVGDVYYGGVRRIRKSCACGAEKTDVEP